MMDRLRPALIFEDESAAVDDRPRLPLPSRPALLATDSWRHRINDGPPLNGASRANRIAAYNPDPDCPVRCTLHAAVLQRPRTVELRHVGATLARWRIAPDGPRTYMRPPLRLPRSLVELSLTCGGESPPILPPRARRSRPIALRLPRRRHAPGHRGQPRRSPLGLRRPPFRGRRSLSIVERQAATMTGSAILGLTRPGRSLYDSNPEDCSRGPRRGANAMDG